ncbi:MAG: hypothetical protein JXR10_03670 [Cyclobacteriaceae bacterium]
MKFKKRVKAIINAIKIANKKKIFCIGQNKTGTTSIKQAFKEMGYVVGVQRQAEELMPEYLDNDYKRIIRYCKTAQVFQDFPFSFPDTYKIMDKAYPGSRFILSVRDTPDQWYNSYVRFYTRLAYVKSGLDKEKESIVSALKSATYISKGWLWEFHKKRFDVSEADPFPKEQMMREYEKYNEEVIEYFKDRKDDLLVLNVSAKKDFSRFLRFLGTKSNLTDFPWEKKAENLTPS